MLNQEELNQLYRYALSLSAHEETAYDLVQSAVEKFLNKQSASIDKPQAYIKTIIRNLYFDQERHKKVVPMISIESDELSHIEPVDNDGMDDLLINQQDVQVLIDFLNAEENELLYLWAVEEHTADEIARIYEKPRGTILSKLHRLKKRMRERFQGDRFDTSVMNKGEL
ncbi:MAG: RNA polymerase subunit sigma-24 [endosymbiont of Galathealinum brachiosum]|uniref:RNA polymerase subunit sigma-24 n=1 Tax=endosymbiont of Galathealinum brachiosum TaxID=2200906 RepID=A0A370DIY3_9GAMM|nr:MAG: RNA polymerase subunit sigma-24 [endosymbiont of Galathealinum brachiosum]